MMLLSIFADNALSTLMSLSIVIGGFVLLFFAYRSNSDGKTLIKKSIEKRNLFAEIILLLMALIEGVNAATYAVKEGRDFGASIAMHVFGGVMSGIFAFGIYKQVMDVAKAVKDQKHPIVIVKEGLDVLGTIILAVLFPIVNTYFVAIAAKHPHDFWNTIMFDWGRISSGSVYYSTVVGMGHVFACFVLSLNSFDTTIFDSNGGTEVPLTQASDEVDSEEAEIITESNLPVPVKFDPEKVNVEDFVLKNFDVDEEAFERHWLRSATFRRDLSNLVVEALTFREEWDNHKAMLATAQREIDVKTRRMKTIENNSYGWNPDTPGRVYMNLQAEIKDIEQMNRHTKREAELAEANYDATLDEIKNNLAVI